VRQVKKGRGGYFKGNGKCGEGKKKRKPASILSLRKGKKEKERPSVITHRIWEKLDKGARRSLFVKRIVASWETKIKERRRKKKNAGLFRFRGGDFKRDRREGKGGAFAAAERKGGTPPLVGRVKSKKKRRVTFIRRGEKEWRLFP